MDIVFLVLFIIGFAALAIPLWRIAGALEYGADKLDDLADNTADIARSANELALVIAAELKRPPADAIDKNAFEKYMALSVGIEDIEGGEVELRHINPEQANLFDVDKRED